MAPGWSAGLGSSVITGCDVAGGRGGFGPAIVPCRGIVWSFGPAHPALHRITRWLSAPLRRSCEAHG